MSDCPAPPHHRRARRGFALEATLMLMVMFSIIILAGLSAVTSLTRTSSADYRSSRAAYASEGGADDLMSQLDAKMQDGVINASDITALQKPVMPGFAFTQSTTTIGIPVARTITSGSFAGLYSLNQPIDIKVSAHDTSGNSATAILSVNAQTIPLFQFGVFYEKDLEIEPGQVMTFAGWVHTNGNLYLSSNSVQFQSQITTPDSVFWQRKDKNERLGGVKINNASGTGVLLDFDSRSLFGAAFVNRSQQKFNGRLMTQAHGVRELKLPLPSGVLPITLVQPKSSSDVAMVQDVKMAWKSDWYIKVHGKAFNQVDTVAMKATFCDSVEISRPAGLVTPSVATCNRIFKPVPNAFYDGREDKRPDLIDIYMDSLRIWADSVPSTRAPRIIYIEVVDDNLVTTNQQGDYVAVRIRGGAQLPKSRASADTGGVSIVTERPLYVLGDFNTTVWRPAALMGDAITILSNPPNAAMANTGTAGNRCSNAGQTGWCDWNNQTYTAASGTQRVARNTTVNAAILAGHSATTCDWQRLGCSAPNYGGGLENFPRFLENWGGGVTLTYTGSLVSLFESRFGTGLWGNTGNIAPNVAGAYYTPPTRNWQFDINFRFPERLPPGTPSVGTVIQTAYRPIY